MRSTRFLLPFLAIATLGAATPEFRLQAAIVAPSALARLHAAGLDPSSATFKSDIAARLAKSRALLEGVRGTTIRAIVPDRMRGFSHTKALTFRRTTTSISAAATLSEASKFGVQNVLPTPSPKPGRYAGSAVLHSASNLGYLAATATSFTFEQLDDFLSGAPVTTSPLPVPGLYIAVVGSATPNLPEPGYGTYTASVADCNVSKSFQYGRLWDPTNKNPSDNYYNWQLPAKTPGLYYYDLSMDLGRASNEGPPFPIGVKPHLMSIAIPSDGMTLTKTMMVTNVDQQVQTIIDTIDETGAIGKDGGVNLTAANVQAGQAGVQRVNTSATKMTGTDIVGKGITLGTGVTATAKIVAAHSIADTADDTSPDNGYRGATVTTPPAGGRLETIVTWYAQPGDSLQYAIQWTFTGAPGQRATLSMPLGGPCDS